MRKILKQQLRCLAITLPLSVFSGALLAQPESCQSDRDVGPRALDEFTWKQLNSIYEEIGEKNYAEANEDLRKMLGRAGKDDYLAAVLNQALGQVEWSQENYDEALEFLERAVELDALPNDTHFGLLYQVAQLYFVNERSDEAQQKLELWFCSVPEQEITAHAFVLKASIHARRSEFEQAVEAIGTAIAMDEDPREQWFQLKLAAQYELKRYPAAAETLASMIARWPQKKLYWMQLAQVHFKLGQDEQTLAVLALAYRKQLLDDPSDIRWLSSMYSNASVPYKAAEVLEKGIRDGIVESGKDNWTAVADTWYAAQELDRALLAYEEAGRVSSDGRSDLRLAYILSDLERWAEAREALERALEKGGLKANERGEAYLLRGLSRFNLGDFEGAGADWVESRRFENTSDSARQWLNHLREERRREVS